MLMMYLPRAEYSVVGIASRPVSYLGISRGRDVPRNTKLGPRHMKIGAGRLPNKGPSANVGGTLVLTTYTRKSPPPEFSVNTFL